MNLVTLCGSEFYPLYEELVETASDADIRAIPNIPAVIRTARRSRPESAVLLVNTEQTVCPDFISQMNILKAICPQTRCFAAGDASDFISLPADVTYIGRKISCSEFMTLMRSLSEGKPKASAYQAEMSETLETTVTEIIRKVGIPANVKGYRYLRSAIILAAGDMTILDHVMTVLYPTVAMANNTTPGRVERAIRHAISIAWSRASGDVDYIERKLHCKIDYTRSRPSNSEFIALISDCLRLNMNR